MQSNIAIEAHELSKCYHIYDNPRDRFLQGLFRGKRQFYKEFWALRNVSFTINQGETFGIVGSNGAGKSTLLQIISKILEPTSGTIQTNGRITALLELGAGLSMEFNGHENIAMNAAILGLDPDETAKKHEEIVKFAELGDFIDRPIKTYSSGMIMRLAFATAVSLDPNILIVDEALAVGDELFQLKCVRRIQEIKERGATILFVSHSVNTVNQICDRAMLLDHGQCKAVGNAKEVTQQYTKLLYGLNQSAVETEPESAAGICADKKVARIAENTSILQREPDAAEQGHKKGHIKAIWVENNDYQNLRFEVGEEVTFTIMTEFFEDVADVIQGMMITTPTGVDCYHTNFLCKDMLIRHCKAGEVRTTRFTMKLNLCPGSYVVVFDCQYDLNAKPKLVDICYEALKFEILNPKLINDGGIAALNARIESSVQNR